MIACCNIFYLQPYNIVGYGAGGRLGIGGIDSVSQPTLLASIQHVFITKVLHSFFKHFP